MENATKGMDPKDNNVQATEPRGDDIDIHQTEGKNYNPMYDEHDMARLGKRQELKVHIKDRGRAYFELTSSSAGFASPVLWAT